MAFSRPTPPSHSSPEKFSNPPIMALKHKIVDKIQENRVTLIVGETGCGKSSQVPQFLLEENMEPILCTQPRRFAVVAVARMVAKSRKCEVGDEVGYHIGHSKVFSARSKIVFKTAGVLLDEMREKGLDALKYKVIILDEVHERSIESDLVLVCVKQLLLRNNDLRLVLMSATADTTRYKNYFKDLGRGERVEVLAVPNSDQHTAYQQKVSYLEQIAELLDIDSDDLSSRYCSGPVPTVADADIKPEVHKLIHDLVLHIHKNEPDVEKSILIFLPTYFALEQQWFLLKPFSTCFKIQILHSSIDTEQALKTMTICKTHRKIILATNIAESSVTIPLVAYVIDSCRSLQVFWDNNRKADSSQLVWVSKSQADQRKGRTGRTCDGQVFRLITESFFGHLPDYEPPAILKLSLRQQVLLICCAKSKAINDPKVLMQKALDPPDPNIVEDALSLLVQIQSLHKTSPRGRYEPTFYGRLLSSFSLSFDASLLLLKFGEMGMLREGILLGVLMDTQPLPIVRPFGDEILYVKYTDSYFAGNYTDTGLTGKKEVNLMANLCAFQFWQRIYKDNLRFERVKELANAKPAKPRLFESEEEWCCFHNLVLSSLHHVAELYEEVLHTIHRFRPNFLAGSDGLPSYYNPYQFEHKCLIPFQQNGDVDTFDTHEESIDETRKCISVPFVPLNNFESNTVAGNLASIIKEIKVMYVKDSSENELIYANDGGNHNPWEPSLCKFFLKGLCNRGYECTFSHSLQAKPPACKFFLSLQGCRKGDSCSFSHDQGSVSRASMCSPENGRADAASLFNLFPRSSKGSLLILDDTDFNFSWNLSQFYESQIISTTCLLEDSVSDPPPSGVRILWGHSHPYQTILGRADNSIPWHEVKCLLWSLKFDDGDRILEEYQSIIQSFFECLGSRLLADSLYEVDVILTMNNIRFSQLQVERFGRESFFFLKESFLFDELSFGDLCDTMKTKTPGVVAKAVAYVFRMYPPPERVW